MAALQQAISNFLGLIQIIILIRILLSWFPDINWGNQPFKLLYELTEPILAQFRRIIPPIGGFDFSPMLIFLVLGMVKSVL